MTKRDIIKNAYENHGFEWNHAKNYVDENGWVNHKVGCFRCLTLNSNAITWRPSELNGIENNNGWHCLSEKDFPEDELTVLWYSDKTNEFENASLLHCDFNFEEYTHWHELPTKAPIY